MKLVILILVSALAFFFAGFLFYDKGIEILLPGPDYTKYQAVTISAFFDGAMWFGISCGLFPVALFSLVHFAKIEYWKKKLVVAGILFGAMILAIVVRYYMIQSELENARWIPLYDIADLKYGFFMLCGLLGGSLIAVIFFRREN